VSGILLFEYFSWAELFAWFFICLGILFLTVHLFLRENNLYKLRWLFGYGVFLFFMGFGFFLSQFTWQKNQFFHLGESGLFHVEVESVPVEKPKSYMLKVQTLSFSKDSVHFSSTQGKALLYLPKTKDARSLCIGDRLLVSTRLSAPNLPGNPEEFNYPQYLFRKGYAANSFVDSVHWCLLQRNSSFSIFQLAAFCQNKLLEIYKHYKIGGDEFAVLGALTLGYQDEIRDELYVSYSNSGALHILSVSGLHVGIIYFIFAFILSFLDKSAKTRLLKSLLIIVLLWMYAFITGLSPSVMRAALMFSLVALGSVFRYKSSIYNTIFFSAFVLLLINPNYIFDVSYLLSYSAVLSIVIFQPPIKRLLHFENKLANWSWDLFCVSIAAQIGTFPLGMYYFHKFSNHFLLTNFIAIPISTGIIYLAVLLFVFASVPFLGNWIAIVLKFLLIVQNKSIVFIDHLPYSTFHRWIDGWEVILMYLCVLFFTLFILRKRYWMLAFALTCVVVFQTADFYRNYKSHQESCMVVYSDKNSLGIDFVANGNHLLYATDKSRVEQLASNYWLKKQLDKSGEYINHNKGFLEFEGKKIGVVADSSFHFKKTLHRLRLDYLILGNKSPVTIRDIENLFEVKTLIVDATFSDSKLNRLKKDCRKAGIHYYLIKEKGAFVLNLTKKSVDFPFFL
jgi:competence protein ComEC